MGNLRDKYTNEEWDELGEKVKKWKSKVLFNNNEENYSLISKVENLVYTISNDQELGTKIRELINKNNIL